MRRVFSIVLRYFLILIFGLGNLYLLYLLFTPLTLNITYFILNIFTSPSLINGFIYFNESIIQIIPACVAGAAYYLLLILILSTPNLSFKKYLKLIGISFGIFFLFNVLRIIFLILIRNTLQFDLIHSIFWYFLSTILVILIWFFLVKRYKLNDYPIISDILFLMKFSKKSKKTKQSNRTKQDN